MQHNVSSFRDELLQRWEMRFGTLALQAVFNQKSMPDLVEPLTKIHRLDPAQAVKVQESTVAVTTPI